MRQARDVGDIVSRPPTTGDVVRIYRWDLDKTYLDTDFRSIRGLVRSATEPAVAKRAVPGATQLMRALCADDQARIFILSGSPVQMREVLSEKLRLDGIRYEQLTLKDSLRHLRKGQVRAILGQFGYKLPALFRSRAGLGRAARETLFGDDAEVDAVVYSVYADAVAGRLSPAQVSRIMEAAGAYPEHIDGALEALSRLSTVEAVERIFIRMEKGRAPERFEPLGTRVIPLFSWLQGALVLMEAGHIDGAAAWRVMETVIRQERLDSWSVVGLCQDIVRRGHLSAKAIDQVEGPRELVAKCRAGIDALGVVEATLRPSAPANVDYLEIFRQW